jgi:hypothetical protein
MRADYHRNYREKHLTKMEYPTKLKTTLLIPLDEARSKLANQIDKIDKLLVRTMKDTRDQAQLLQNKIEYRIWLDYTKELLTQIFNTDKIAGEFVGRGLPYGVTIDPHHIPTFQEEVTDFLDDLSKYQERLISIHAKLELFPVLTSKRGKGIDSESYKSQVNNIKRLIKKHQRRLQILKEQQALKGINSEPELVMEIEGIEEKIEGLMGELRELEKSYQN